MNRTRRHRALIWIGVATMIACELPLLVQGGRAGQGGAARTKLAEAPTIRFFGSYRVAVGPAPGPHRIPVEILSGRILLERDRVAREIAESWVVIERGQSQES